MGLFKNGDDFYNTAIDMMNRKDISGARACFEKAISKGCAKKDHAQFCLVMIDTEGHLGDPRRYRYLQDAIAKLPAGPVTYGVTSADRDMLLAQIELALQEIEAVNMSDSNYMAKGQAMINVAAGFASRIGEENLPLQELLKGTSQTGNHEALMLQALAYEVMGKGAVYADPKQGSEYLQMAYNFRRQLGQSGEDDLRLMRQFATTGRCWICGRPVSGQGIHFMAVRSEFTDMFRNKEENEAVKSSGDNYSDIFMCLPCYSALSNRANEIAVSYYNDAMSQMRAMEARLQAEIAAVRMSASFNR